MTSPGWAPARRPGWSSAAGQRLAAFGLTSACDADMRRDTFAAFAEADAGGLLSQRIYGLVVHDQVDWLLAAGLQGRHSGRLATEAVKIWADGGMSSRTAAIHGTYPVPPHGSGILYFERDELTEMVRDFDARGFQVCIHAQGDRAIETVLDAYAAVLAPGAGNPRRHRIEHGGAMYPPLAARAAALGIVVASQPGFLSALGDGFAAAFPDQQRPAVLLRLLAAGRHHRRGILRRTRHHRRSPHRHPRRHRAPHRRRPRARPRRAPDRPRRARPVHHPGRLRLPPGERDRLARAGQARRLRRPGRQNPLETEPGQIPDIGVLATVLGGTPVYQSRKHLPRPLTASGPGFQIPGKGAGSAGLGWLSRGPGRLPPGYQGHDNGRQSR